MKKLLVSAMIVLAAYSIALMCTEILGSQQLARIYFTDIGSEHLFYGINTTLSASLLWATSLVFLVCWRIQPTRFHLSQAVMFFLLGFDDRFVLHEQIGPRLGLPDALIFGTLGVLEVVFLLALGKIHTMDRTRQTTIVVAGALFALMVAVDEFSGGDWLLRLSIEDLAKMWAGFCLFLFSWQCLEAQIAARDPKIG